MINKIEKVARGYLCPKCESTTLYKLSDKRVKCPKCGSTRIANILYGLPAYSIELMDNIHAGKVALGGCCVTDDDPVWECANSETKIYKKDKKNI